MSVLISSAAPALSCRYKGATVGTNYTIGSIWTRRDGKQAAIISPASGGEVRAIEVCDTVRLPALPYLVHTGTGRVSKSGNYSPMDLVHRADGIEVDGLLTAAEGVTAAWQGGDLAAAVRELDRSAKAVREAA